jgi:hypothetical protein
MHNPSLHIVGSNMTTPYLDFLILSQILDVYASTIASQTAETPEIGLCSWFGLRPARSATLCLFIRQSSKLANLGIKTLFRP